MILLRRGGNLKRRIIYRLALTGDNGAVSKSYDKLGVELGIFLKFVVVYYT